MIKINSAALFIGIKVLFLHSLFIFICVTANARPNVSSFRCGSHIVKIGDTKHEVSNTCGEPTSRETVAADKRGYYFENDPFENPEQDFKSGSYRSVTRKVEEWYYNCGSYNFSYILVFLGSDLYRIEQVGYGEGTSNCLGKKNGNDEEREIKSDKSLNNFDYGEYILRRLKELSQRVNRPIDDLLEEAINDLYRKYDSD